MFATALTACTRAQQEGPAPAPMIPGSASAPESPSAPRPAPAAPNVLFILIDDLNAWVGCLGHTQAKTPHIDALAARGVLFTNAHCAGPECNPSRAALLSGVRPTTSGVYTNADDWKKHIPAGFGLTVPWKRAGYTVLGAGKIAHGSRHYGSEWDDNTAAEEDDEADTRADGLREPASTDGSDQDVPDWQVVDYCIAQLGKTHARPFFLACGLRKPHLPWAVPRKYYERFPAADLRLPPQVHDDLADLPRAAVALADPLDEHRKVLKNGRWLAAVQGYLAACAYTDMNVGRLLDALARSAHASNTIVVLLSDHGFHLGEKSHWGNETLWEPATRVPLVFAGPGIAAGAKCNAAVDLLAVFPTLCELAGLQAPAHLEGKSLRALLADPTAACDGHALTSLGAGNHAVRTARWRYIRYADGSEELYDHERDGDEWRNLAGVKEFADTKAALQRLLPADPVAPGKSRLDDDDKKNGKGKKDGKKKGK
jgi:arylsulfatase A-like enzyme